MRYTRVATFYLADYWGPRAPRHRTLHKAAMLGPAHLAQAPATTADSYLLTTYVRTYVLTYLLTYYLLHLS